MRLHIIFIGIMHIIRSHQLDASLSAHTEELGIYLCLLRDAVILQFQKKVSLPKALLITQCDLFCFLVLITDKRSLYFSGQTSAQGNDSLMILPQHFHIHTRPVIISFRISPGYDLHQVTVTGIIFCKKHQMIVSVFPMDIFTVKP